MPSHILSDISSDVLSDIQADLAYLVGFFLHCVCQDDVLSGISPGLLSGWPFSCCVRSDMVSDGWSDTLSCVRPDNFSKNLSGMS